MTDGQQPEGVPDAPWGNDQPPPAQPGQALANEQTSAGGIAIPGQSAPTAPQHNDAPSPAPNEQSVACHRSWLMGMRPAARAKPPTIDPRTQQIVDIGGQEEVIMIPVPSPYGCIGSECSMWDTLRNQCKEVAAIDAQIAVAEAQLAAMQSATNDASPEVSIS